MASSQEKGVLNFLAEFSKMNTTLTGFGITFNPPEKLRLSNLQDSLSRATGLISELNVAYSANKNAISVRSAAYKTLPSLVTRVVNFFAITSADSALKANVKSAAAKLHPSSKKSKSTQQATSTMTMDENGTTETPKTHSTAQTGYDNKLGHLRLIIALVSTESTYSPAETEITIASLNSFASELEHCNQLVVETQSRLYSLRKQRNELLYGKKNSLAVLGREVKQYVKAAYSANSKEAKAINSICLS